MPLVRLGVRNEYGLGVEELYKDGVQSEDPKAVLDGVAVAGLVGVLRQLGDLAQFAAEVFHGLQEQVAYTSSRSHKLVTRIQRIEASLPLLEKAILSQTDHLRFAYTPGTDWHASIKDEHNHFICDDLPFFIMDSYEECREPPRLQLLDRFDTGGPGSCLKRYTDPTFFRRASSCSEDSNSEKSQQTRKAQKIKKRGSWHQSGQFPNSASILHGSGSMQFSSTGQGQSSLSHTGSIFDTTFKSDQGYQSDSRDSKNCTDFINIVSHSSISTQPDATKNKGLSILVGEAEVNSNGTIYLEELTAVVGDDNSCSYDVEANVQFSSSATWDEKLEILEHMEENNDVEDTRQVPLANYSLPKRELQLVNKKSVNQANDLCDHGSSPTSRDDGWHLRTTGDGHFIDHTKMNCEPNEVPHFLKLNIDLQEHHLKPVYLKSGSQLMDVSEGGSPPELTTNSSLIYEPEFRSLGTDEAQYVLEPDFDVLEKELEKTASNEHESAVDKCIEGGNDARAIEWDQKAAERYTVLHVRQEDIKAIKWNQLDLGIVNSELVSGGDAFSEDRSNVNVIEWSQKELEAFDAGHANPEDDTFYEGAASSGCGNNVRLVKWNEWELETQNNENVSQVQVIEWNQIAEIDSGTENFVDALNTIESEPESDFETEMKKEVRPTALKDKMVENAVNSLLRDQVSHSKPEHQLLSTSNEQTKMKEERATAPKDEEAVKEMSYKMTEKPSHAEPEHQCLSTSYHHKDDLEELEKSTAPVLSLNFGAPESTFGEKVDVISQIAFPSKVSKELTQLSHNEFESIAGQKADVISQIAFPSNVPKDLASCADEPEKILETVVSEITKSGSDTPGDERGICAPNVCEKMSVGSSSTFPHAFWTDGKLLGLQPLKPTVVSIPNSVDSGPTSRIDKVGQYKLDAMQQSNDFSGTPPLSVNGHENRNKLGIDDQDVGCSKYLSHQRSEKTPQNSVNHDNGILRDHAALLDLSNITTTPLESKVLGINVKNASSEASTAREDRSSLLSLLSRGLLRNSLRWSGSLGSDERHEGNRSSKIIEYDNRFQDAVVPETKQGKLSSPGHSPPPSPPLEHIKICFQPVDGFDTSRLKLKYPEGVDHIENTLDVFPSFQLVPESTSFQHDLGSDSDDDTFCRSHAYMSDKSHSNLSDSDSEQWESGDSTESNDPTLYNGSHRISSVESASISPRHGPENHRNVPLSGSSFGLAILDAKNPFAYQDMKLCLKPGVDSSHAQEPTHDPPPPPPLQWRVSRPQFDETEGNQGWGSDNLSQPFVPKISDFAIAYPALVDSTKLISTVQESATIGTSKKVEEQNSGQEQTYDANKEHTMDDGGDFLHQIRTKSFNLKRMEPTRSTYMPLPTTSNKITAILQKANAIRQAIGSDDGEDDSWSDT